MNGEDISQIESANQQLQQRIQKVGETVYNQGTSDGHDNVHGETGFEGSEQEDTVEGDFREADSPNEAKPDEEK